jgi:capsule polysaccharide modification protein KpsS
MTVGTRAQETLRRLRKRIERNVSNFAQPPQGGLPVEGPYSLFVCQVPHDEAILFHSDVSVEQALCAVLSYAQHHGLNLVVKGHPANPKSMQPLREKAEASPCATWVDNISIHSCLARAEKVYLVNSGVGFEALLHDRSVVRFGRAEYDCVVPQAGLDIASLRRLESRQHSLDEYAAFLHGYLNHCIRWDDPLSYPRVLEWPAPGFVDTRLS